jgi:hypothetical protein
VEYVLNGVTYSATRYKLREWLKLDAIREKLTDAIDAKDIDGIANSLCTFVSVASDAKEIETLPWYEVADAFITVEIENQPKYKFALFRSKKESIDDPAWEYEGRQWYWWLNILASRYGWSAEYIAELDVDDATGLLQEILVDEQLEREWQWSLTELAYPYNESTKKSNFKPLDRPKWMMTVLPENQPKIPTIHIRKDMFPAGIVIKGKHRETPVN